MRMIHVFLLKLIHMFMFITDSAVAFMISFMLSFKSFFNNMSLIFEINITDFTADFMMSFMSSFENKNFDSCAIQETS